VESETACSLPKVQDLSLI